MRGALVITFIGGIVSFLIAGWTGVACFDIGVVAAVLADIWLEVQDYKRTVERVNRIT